MHSDSPAEDRPGVRGQWAVLGMLLFGGLLTTVLWIYWERHSAPFRPLQDAIAREFPRSRPRVQGGRRKMHEEGPRILQVVLKVDFNPQNEERNAEDVADRVVALAQAHQDLSRYDQIEIHLFWPEPEREIVERQIVRKKPFTTDAGRPESEDRG